MGSAMKMSRKTAIALCGLMRSSATEITAPVVRDHSTGQSRLAEEKNYHERHLTSTAPAPSTGPSSIASLQPSFAPSLSVMASTSSSLSPSASTLPSLRPSEAPSALLAVPVSADTAGISSVFKWAFLIPLLSISLIMYLSRNYPCCGKRSDLVDLEPTESCRTMEIELTPVNTMESQGLPTSEYMIMSECSPSFKSMYETEESTS